MSEMIYNFKSIILLDKVLTVINGIEVVKKNCETSMKLCCVSQNNMTDYLGNKAI